MAKQIIPQETKRKSPAPPPPDLIAQAERLELEATRLKLTAELARILAFIEKQEGAHERK